jgi:hypothetical protein
MDQDQLQARLIRKINQIRISHAQEVAKVILEEVVVVVAALLRHLAWEAVEERQQGTGK